MNSAEKPKAIDLSHHLSDVSRARATSPLKGLARFFGRPGLISLAGGMPAEDYFPFADISADVLIPDSFSVQAKPESPLAWFWSLFGGKEKTTSFTIPKYPSSPDEVNLAVALQYGTATGLPQLSKFIKEFVDKVYQPAYEDCATLIDTGNTDGWGRVVLTLCNPGEGILTEDWTYPSAMAGMKPFGIQPVPVAMDSEGMRSDDLRKVLAEWDEAARGFKRPHVMYTVPIGQNPSGATMGAVRKQEIYDICAEYDIIIVEDDPYFFLQFSPAVASRANAEDSAKFIASLAPSYLKFDTQGRVIRLDTFSKYIAPGSRLGWFTCNPLFAERLERQGETTTQAPCGFGQSLVAKLLQTWKYDGYVRWLHGLAVEYKHRRDYLVKCFAEEFQLERSYTEQGVWAGCEVYGAFAKPNTAVMSEKSALGKKMFSFVPPSSGMFIWFKVHLENLPPSASVDPDEETPEVKIWVKLAESGVLVAPGAFFAADQVMPPEVGQGHFRIAFSNASDAALKKAVAIFGQVLREFFQQ